MLEVSANQADTAQRRHNLITESARLALQIEDAENSGNAIAEARLRVSYHTAQAELIAVTPGASLAAREDHLALARTYQRELVKLDGDDV